MTDTQISVGMNVDGVVTGTEKAKRKISELGGAAREAGKGTGAIGDGMAGAATKVEAATKNMVGSIQRQIAALEAGDKSSRKYQESLARMRGIDVAALKPYLDQLDAMKIKQAEAAAQQAHLAEGMGFVRSAAMAGAAAAMAGAAGFAAFAKSAIDAADGMNDLSQRVGISVKELGKYQLAAEQSGTSMDAIAKGVKGLADNMSKHGEALRKLGIDSKTADGAMQQLADVFAAMPDGMEKTTLATKMFGKAGMDLIPMLNLGSKGLAEAAEKSAKYAEQMALAAPMADAFNDSMAEIGMYTKVAGMAMVNDMLPALVDISKAMSEAAQKGGILAGVMAGLDSLGNNLFDWNGNAQRKNIANLTDDLEDLRDKQNAITLDIFGKKGQIQAEIEAKIKALDDAKKAYFGITQGNAGRGSVNPASVKPAVDWGADYKGIMAAMGGDGSAKKAISEANKELEQQAKLLAELSGYTSDYEASQQRLAAMLKSGAMNQEAYNRAAQELVAKQPGMLAAAKAQAEALKEIAKLQADYEASLQKSVTAGADELAKAQAAYDAHGKLASVLQEELLARMEITREQIAGGAGSETELNAITQQIKDKRELIKVLRNGEVRDASEKAAKDAADEWKKASEKIEQDITDALMRGFESGKGFAEVLKDTIENTFKTMVIRPMIQGVVQGGMNAVGLGSAQGGGTINGIGGAINTANSMNSIYAAGSQFLYGSSVGASAASLAAGNMAGMVGGDALGTMIAANGSWAGVSAGTAAGTAAAGTAATGAGAASSLAAAGPYVAAAIAAYTIADSLFGSKGGPKSDSSYNMGGFGDASATGLAGTYATGVEDAWKTLAKELEITTALKVGALTSIDTQGDAKTILRANATVDGVGVYDRATRMGTAENVGRSQEELQAAMAEETTRILFAALKASDLPEQYKTYLNTIGDSVADMTEAMTIVAVVDDFNDALQSLPFENLKTLSFEAAKGLIEVAGGMDVLGANLGTYYTNFYSAEEQRAQTIKTINAATAGSGLDAATVTRDQFRQIVEAQDLTTESGRATYAALLGVSGAMATLITASETAAAAANKAAAEANKAAAKSAIEATITATQNAADDLITLYGDLTAAMSEIRPPVKSLVDQWYDSTEALTTLTQGLAEALGELPEATVLDKLKATLATLASATDGIANISDQIFGLQTGKGNQAAVNLLQGRETALFAELATSNDPGAVAAKLASTMLTRIKLQGELADKVTNDALKSQFDASTTLAQLEKTNRDKQIDAIRKQISAAETLLDVVGSMKGYLAELRFSDLSALNPGDQLSAAQGNYTSLLAGAKGGDTKAMQDLQGGASSYLQEAQSYYGGATSQYASIFSAVTSGLEQFGATPVTDITLLQNQLDYLEKIEAASIDLQTVVTDTTDLQIEGLNSINTVLTTRQDEARQEAADNKKAVQEQIAELKAIVAGQEAQIKQQAAIYEGLMERLTTATKALESLDNTSKQTAAAPV